MDSGVFGWNFCGTSLEIILDDHPNKFEVSSRILDRPVQLDDTLHSPKM